MPQITVIIPVLNGMPHLTEALASLAAQTCRDFVVHLWDNGSTDGSVEEARAWIPHRIPGTITSGRPLPLHQCLATMVEEAATPYLARFDADDVCRPERFALQLRALHADPRIAVVGGQLRYMDVNGQALPPGGDYPLRFEEVLARMLFQCALPHPAVMMRREMILAAGNYRVPKPVEDLDLWYRVARQGKLINLPETLVDYRIHATSVTKSAQAAGTHQKAVRDCMAANIPPLFGATEADYRKLADRTHPNAARVMRTWARSIAQLADVPTPQVLRSPVFLFSARALTRQRDIPSKLAYFWWGRDPSRSLFSQASEKAAFLPGFRDIRIHNQQRRQKRVLERWTRAQRRRGSTIERLDIWGRRDWTGCVEVGERISLEKEVTFAFPADGETCPGLFIGNSVFIGRNTFLSAIGRIEIGDNVLIGAYGYIAAANHRFESIALPIASQGYELKTVKIGRGAWLGAHVIVLPGVTIGEDAIVGGGAVVTRDIPNREIWAGVPAKKIRDR